MELARGAVVIAVLAVNRSLVVVERAGITGLAVVPAGTCGEVARLTRLTLLIVLFLVVVLAGDAALAGGLAREVLMFAFGALLARVLAGAVLV
jgi:hypothetical protein